MMIKGYNIQPRAGLSGANLSGTNLSWADLSGTNLSWADLSGANLSGTNLSRANLSRANLSGADLSGANLSGTNLNGADLNGADLPHYLISPLEGGFIAYKALRDGIVCKIYIPPTAKRMNSLISRKCRASCVKVLEAYDRNGKVLPKGVEISGWRGQSVKSFKYTVGEYHYPDKFDDDIRVECTHGIHYFMTRKEAEEW